jgi:hypothetical protein
MSKQSERLHAALAEITERLQCSFFDACIELCKDNELDPEDLVKQLDEFTIDRVKQCAIDEHMICKKDLGTIVGQLPFE